MNANNNQYYQYITIAEMSHFPQKEPQVPESNASNIPNENNINENKHSESVISQTQDSTNFNKTSIHQYCEILKQFRDENKPPLEDQTKKEKLYEKFDNEILEKTLSDVGEYIHAQKELQKTHTELSNEPQSTNSNKPEESPNNCLYSTTIDKILLYTWQLTNIRTISNSQLPETSIENIHKLCIWTSRIYVSKWGLRHVTMKAMLIAYFNLLKNNVIESSVERNGSICCLIEAVLGDTEGDECKKFVNGGEDYKKSSTTLELEWFVYILEFCVEKNSYFIKDTFIELSNNNLHKLNHSAFSFLHFISLILNKIVNDRSTTEIIKGYPCTIEDINKMYNQKGTNIELKINWIDYEWIIDTLLKEVFKGYKKEIKGVWLRFCEQSAKNPQIDNDDKKVNNCGNYDKTFIECILTIIGVINCCNFLGGYNPEVQKKTGKILQEFVFEFLEISFLIYEISYAKKRSIELKIESVVKSDYISNLENVLNIHKIDTTQKEEPKETPKYENLSKVLPLEEGQLVAIIRLLSNLVHINTEMQTEFEENLKYFRIVMSLTHEVEGQLTMKNWAIVFLKNVSERSEIMRGELEKLKIDVKIDNGDMPSLM